MFRLDDRMFALLEAMDSFNALPAEEKRPQRTWLDFANIKRWANEVNATLDAALLKNDVVVPSSIGLDFYEDEDGALSFVPTCPELEDVSFRTVFDRNSSVDGFYSLDQPGMGKLRIVLTVKQQRVLERMKRVRRVTGERKEALKTDPRPVFDGVTGDVELPYGDRVIGIGEYDFVPIPKASSDEGPMSGLWGAAAATSGSTGGPAIDDGAEQEKPAKKTLLIDTHDEFVRQDYREESEHARLSTAPKLFERPNSLRSGFELKHHQETRGPVVTNLHTH